MKDCLVGSVEVCRVQGWALYNFRMDPVGLKITFCCTALLRILLTDHVSYDFFSLIRIRLHCCSTPVGNHLKLQDPVANSRPLHSKSK